MPSFSSFGIHANIKKSTLYKLFFHFYFTFLVFLFYFVLLCVLIVKPFFQMNIKKTLSFQFNLTKLVKIKGYPDTKNFGLPFYIFYDKELCFVFSILFYSFEIENTY